jgi:DNA polymerase-3 subunit alpha
MTLTDPYGRVIFDEDALYDMLMNGDDITGLFGDNLERYNELCEFNDKSEFTIGNPPDIDISVDDYHSARQQEWLIPDQYQGIDVWDILIGKCKNDDEINRVMAEKVLFQKRDLDDVLRLMLYLVDSFRERGILWGVGRGSSVASFVLYLIGITKINPMRYGLAIDEFLRD